MGLVLAFLMMLVVVAVLILVGGIGFFSFSGHLSPAQQAASARHTLDDRFRRGQISAEEYRHWSALLHADEVRAAKDSRS